MSIQQTLVGLEKAFEHRAVILSRDISRDNIVEDSESSWLQVRVPFPIQQIRVHNRARNEQRIPNDLIETMIDNNLRPLLPNGAEITRSTAIGAMYRDDLPIANAVYANQYIVISLEADLDIPLPRDAEVSVEMYFGLLANGGSWRIANTWYHHVSVGNVGPLRKKIVRDRVRDLLTTPNDGTSPGEQIRNGLRTIFNKDGISNWYVIPGDGQHNSDDSDIVVRHNASFFYTE